LSEQCDEPWDPGGDRDCAVRGAVLAAGGCVRRDRQPLPAAGWRGSQTTPRGRRAPVGIASSEGIPLITDDRAFAALTAPTLWRAS